MRRLNGLAVVKSCVSSTQQVCVHGGSLFVITCSTEVLRIVVSIFGPYYAPVDSSAARMPFPAVAIARALATSSSANGVMDMMTNIKDSMIHSSTRVPHWEQISGGNSRDLRDGSGRIYIWIRCFSFLGNGLKPVQLVEVPSIQPVLVTAICQGQKWL